MKWLFWFFPVFLVAQSSPIDRRLNEMSLEEKVGMLFIVPICPKRGESHFKDVERAVKQYYIRSAIVKEATVEEQLNMIDWVNKQAGRPLLIVQDAEWGLGMRMPDTISFPKNLTLGAITDDSLIYDLGREIGRELSLVGAHISLGPVVDVNSNPKNPIIHMRSFGNNQDNVASKAVQMVRGLQDSGVYACLKHFPGHGDVEVDSHLDLPVIKNSKEFLESIDLHPFVLACKEGVKCVMSAHIVVPALTKEESLPTPFSREVITSILQNKMGFQGLVITDALNMKALSDRYSPEEIAVNCLISGHDLLLYGDHIAPKVDDIYKNQLPKAIKAVKEAALRGQFDLDSKVRKILLAREELCFHQKGKSIPEEVQKRVTESKSYALKERLFSEAITVKGGVFTPLKGKKIAYFPQGKEDLLFREELEKEMSFSGGEDLLVPFFSMTCKSEDQFGISIPILEMIEAQAEKRPVTVVLFGSPYAAKLFSDKVTVIVAYENCPEAKRAALNALIGKIYPKGQLPI